MKNPTITEVPAPPPPPVTGRATFLLLSLIACLMLLLELDGFDTRMMTKMALFKANLPQPTQPTNALGRVKDEESLLSKPTRPSSLDDVSDTEQNLYFDVTKFGAIGNGIADDTDIIRTVLEKAKAAQHKQLQNHQKGSSTKKAPPMVTIYFPKSMDFITGPLNLTCHTVFQIDGTLSAITNSTPDFAQQWPLIPPLANYGTSEDNMYSSSIDNDDDHDDKRDWLGYTYLQYQSFLYAKDASHIKICGEGIIDGNGPWWWDVHQNHQGNIGRQGGRPNLIQFLNSSQIEITGVTMKDSPFWTLHPVLSTDIHIHHARIRAPMYAPNVDGIDPDSSRNMVIEHNDISCGDDHIAIKSGRCGNVTSSESHGIPSCADDEHFQNGEYVTSNITIRYNKFRTGMGIALGSELSGGIEDINVYDNIIGLCEHGHEDNGKSCGWGIAIHFKTTLTRGGFLRNIIFSNNIIYNTTSFLQIETDYQDRQQKQYPPYGYTATEIRNISIVGNTGLGMAKAMNFGCSPLMMCEDILVKNNWIGASDDNDDKDDDIYHCSYVDKYRVSNNYPDGLEECMSNSMNRTMTKQSDIVASTSSSIRRRG